jgi:hypothetical protein
MRMVIKLSVYIFERLAFNKKDASKLLSLGLHANIVNQIEVSWSEYGDALFNSLKKQRLCTPDGLDSFNWILNIPLENSEILAEAKAIFAKDESEETKPHLRLVKDAKAPMVEMSFATSDTSVPGNPTEKKKTQSIKFTKQGLQGFFEELEKMQVKLDEIAN